MQANKSAGTKPEILLAKMLFARGHRYRKNNKTVFGKPDFTFKKLKIAIFVDGEFWHGKDWHVKKYDHKTNQEFWYKKIERNIERDREVNEELAKQGWTVLRFWSSDIEKNLLSCVLQIEREIYNLKMDLKEKISLYTFGDKQFRTTEIEADNNNEAILTHYLHNSEDKFSKIYKKDAINFTKEILEYKYPEEEITTKVAEDAFNYSS